jgi:hypothetical protein
MQAQITKLRIENKLIRNILNEAYMTQVRLSLEKRIRRKGTISCFNTCSILLKPSNNTYF